jgi:hypothetical protein
MTTSKGLGISTKYGNHSREMELRVKPACSRVSACHRAITYAWHCCGSSRLQRSLDPFQLAKVIDKKLEPICRLANRRLSPKAQEHPEISQAKSGRRKGCGKDAAWKSRTNPEIPPFPRPQQQALSGYISNGATWVALVTFANGLTRPGSRKNYKERLAQNT